MTDQLSLLNRHESNPFRPDLPESIQEVSSELFLFLREMAETLRDQHNRTQAGDSTYSWEILTQLELEPRYTLGSLGRFYHDDYGMIRARYVQFTHVSGNLPSGSPFGFDLAQARFKWQATNQIDHSRKDLILGLGAAYESMIEGSYGWVIVDGVNIQSILCTEETARWQRVAWADSGFLEPATIETGPAIAQLFDVTELADSDWKVPIAALRINLTGVPESIVDLPDLAPIEANIVTLQSQQAALEAQVAALAAQISTQGSSFQQGLTLIQRRLAGVTANQQDVSAEIQDNLQIMVNFRSATETAAANAEGAAQQAFSSATVTNQLERSARAYATEAGVFAETSTVMANTATIQNSLATGSAAASAISAAAALASETAAGLSASAALTSETNADVSEGNAAASAGTAATQASSATASAASALASSILAARIGSPSMLYNPTFGLTWSGGFPQGWLDQYGTGTITQQIGIYSGQAIRIVTGAGGYGGVLATGTLSPALSHVRFGQYVVVEATVELISGSLSGAGVAVLELTAGGTPLAWDVLDFFTERDSTGAVVGAGTVGQIYTFSKVIRLSQPTVGSLFFSALAHGDMMPSSIAAANSIQFHRANIRPQGDEASVATMSQAGIDSSGNAIASWSTSTVAGAASAAIRIESRVGGSVDSTIALEMQELQLWDSTTRKLAMRVQSGNAQFMGDLNVGAALTVGSRRINVALQSFQVAAGDGESISFGADLTNTPVLLFDSRNLAAKTAAQAYSVYATSLTSTGFTMNAKILTPGATSIVTSSAGSNVGGSPTWQAQKSDAADAYDGWYELNGTIQVNNTDYDGLSYGGYGELEFWVRPSGGAWTSCGRFGDYFYHPASGVHSFPISWLFYYAGVIGQHGSNTEFGVSNVSGLLSAWTDTTYTKQATSGVSSATPSGEKVIVTVVPQNV